MDLHKRNCAMCGTEHVQKLISETSEAEEQRYWLGLCLPCFEKVKANPKPELVLFWRISKKRKELRHVLSDLRSSYDALIAKQRTSERIALDIAQEAHEKEHGFNFFGPRWRPE